MMSSGIGPNGLIGWVHGTLVLVYLQALFSTRKLLGWSWSKAIAGAVGGMLPFGSFVFEWKALEDRPTPDKEASV